MNKVLVLGAGMVARPLVRYLLDQPGFQVTVASRTICKADALVGGHPHGSTATLMADNTARLEALVAAHDLTVSLLPAPLHPVVAGLCIKRRKHMVTTSYVSPKMRELDRNARFAGVMVLNEIGVDPGIDHMSAMRIIDDARHRDGKVVRFKSYCGGLPAPESNDNPWGYKFSWSPRAVCTAGKNPARYRVDGQTVDIPGPELFADGRHGMEVEGVGYLEAYPNRDSTGYIDLYGLEGIKTMFRGTFRYPGWCETLKKVVALGLLDESPTTYPKGTTFAQFLHGFLRRPSPGGLRRQIAAQLELPESSAVLDRFEWLGLFSEEEIHPTQTQTTPLDVLASRMLKKMSYREGERDMIVLCHDFLISYVGAADEHVTSTMIDFGQTDGDSSMSRTVSLPAAVAAKLILTRAVMLPGVHIPVVPEIYRPVLDELASMDIRCIERTETVP